MISLSRVLPLTGTLLLVVGLAVGGRGDGRSSAGPLPAGAVDSVEAARRALSRCGRLAPEPRGQCYREILVPLARDQGPRLALGALRIIGSRDPLVVRDGHQYTHLIGITAYHSARDVEATFAGCTELYQSGCYHGVLQAYFTDQPQADSATVQAVCSRYTRPDADQWIRFQCVHGMGHGLTMAKGGDLPAALLGCDLLAQAWDRESCYGGAFMENVVGPMHAAGGAEHHHGPSSGFRPRDPTDSQYPCSIVAERHRRACYSMQASIFLEMNGEDFAAAAASCDSAPAGHRSTCYQSLGTNAAGRTPGDDPRAIRLCSAGDEAYQPWCFLGVVKNRVDVTARIEDGFPFCAQVPGERNRLKCYEAIGEEMVPLAPAPVAREEWCRRAPDAYREACRFGARLTAERPPGLPGG